VITARAVETGDSLRVVPVQQGQVGHFVATITFPRPGIWNWSVKTISQDQPLPPLSVLPPGPTGQMGPISRESVLTWVPSVGFGLLSLVGGVFAWLSWRKSRRQIALVVCGAAVAFGLAGFVFAAIQILPSEANAESAVPSGSTNLAATGKALFLAKGCVVCHQNDAVADQRGDFQPIEIGPDLTNLRPTSEFLHRWLKDPSAVKPGTGMPTLGLTDAEIDALTAFLTSP
jgi:mono/diheme cytochrome c family protein